MDLPLRDQASGWQRLGLALAVVAVIWGGVLPQLERMPAIQARIKHLDDQGIDPAALFYSDHEGMEAWATRIREAQDRHPEAFW